MRALAKFKIIPAKILPAASTEELARHIAEEFSHRGHPAALGKIQTGHCVIVMPKTPPAPVIELGKGTPKILNPNYAQSESQIQLIPAVEEAVRRYSNDAQVARQFNITADYHTKSVSVSHPQMELARAFLKEIGEEKLPAGYSMGIILVESKKTPNSSRFKTPQKST